MTDTQSLQIELFGIQQASATLLKQLNALRRAGDLIEAREVGAQLSQIFQAQVDGLERLAEASPELVQAGLYPTGPQIDTWLSRADIAEGLGLTEEAAALREQGLAAARDQGDIAFAERQRQMAGTWLEQGRPHEALVALRAARELALAADAPFLAAKCRAGLASALEDLCDDEQALAEVQVGYAELEAAGWQVPEAAPAADDIARTIESLLSLMGGSAGPPAAATPLISPNHADAQSAWCDMAQIEARIARRRGNYECAATLFAQVRPFVLSYAHPALDYQLLMIDVAARRHAQALKRIDELLPGMQQGAVRRKLGHVLLLRARVLHESGRPAEALPFARQAGVETETYPDLHLAWSSSAREGDILLALGAHEEALAAYERSATVIGWLRRAPLGHRLDSLYLADKLPVLRNGIRLAARLGRADVVHRLLDQLKSRQLAATLAVPDATVAADGPAQDFTRRIAMLSQKLVQAEHSAADAKQVAQWVRQRQALVDEQRVAQPRWRVLSEPVVADSALDLKALAQADAAGLSLYVDEEGLIALVLSEGRCEVFAHTPSAVMSAHLARLENSGYAGTYPDEPAPTLEDLLPAPALARLQAHRHWCVVPHGATHLLRWPLLTLQGEPVLTRHSLSLLPSLGLLHLHQPAPSRPRAVHTVGVSAQGWPTIDAGPECQAVSALYEALGVPVADALIEEAATRDAVRTLLGSPRPPGSMLHLACHGEMDPDEPMLSSLKLADGQLDATEVAQAGCTFSEVVLSACSVGRRGMRAGGVVSAGDELLGLAGAFVEAGAAHLLVSLTPVRDGAARALMQLYHAARAAGRTSAAALREAQVTMLEEGIFEPAEWGGFAVFGSP